MVSTDASAPLLQVEGETRLLPTLVETTIVKVEVTNIGKNENSVNGGGEPGDVDSGVTVRRKRGWPPGTGKLQLLATMGARMSYIECGEMRFFGKILSVVETSPQAVCILSAVGAVAIVDMCPAGYFGSGVLRYEA
ncbi:hypothetical protein RHMOL_Rhmol01G0035900 [Rhododendron molle]|uniref:Uncharacterized protein n=1 Tax=Rhododendron molle TaxID=49168 RepID=A0ACC0PZ73_RHOML|nr:hypothetical protein RHMOL_Rhmol01G0035900 [Rhododendron molle]